MPFKSPKPWARAYCGKVDANRGRARRQKSRRGRLDRNKSKADQCARSSIRCSWGCSCCLIVSLAIPQAANAFLPDPTARQVAFVVGRMTDNEWGDLFIGWDEFAWRDAGFVGGAVSWEWSLGRYGSLGTEVQVIGWAGEQTHLELTLPVFYRTPRPEPVWIPSLAYGLGLSLASKPPETEVARTGESTELLAHWFFELEFGNSESRLRPFLRLHHRSHAWEAFDARTGSNALGLGLRTEW